MSTDRAAAARALRLAVGTALGFTAATALGWPAAMLTPILFIQLAAGARRCPGPRAVLVSLAGITACVGVGWVLTFTIAMPALCVLLIALLLFTAFWLQAGGAGGLVPFVLMIAAALLPTMALQAPGLASVLALELIRASAAAFLLLWLTWAAFPDPRTAARLPEPSGPRPSPTAPAGSPGTDARARVALVNTALAMPVVLAFLLFELSSAAVALITILAILRMQTGTVRLGMAGGLLWGNVLAAFAAVLATAVIYAAPSLPMLFLVLLLLGLLFARPLVRVPPARAALWVTGLTSTVALLDAALSALGEGAGSAAWTRVINLALAVFYVSVAIRLTASLRITGGQRGTTYPQAVVS